MLTALLKSLAQLNDPAIRKVLGKTIALALVLFVVLFIAIGFLLGETQFFAIGWLETATQILGGLATLAISWLLFPSIAVLILGFYLEDVAVAVETRHYPGLGPPRVQPLREAMMIAIKFGLIAVGLNILILPLYLIPVVNVLAYYGLNGYLLGREYFELVALRRLEEKPANDLRRIFSGRVILSGIVIAFLSTLPIINLVAPVIGTLMMVHIVEGLRQKQAAAEK